MQKTGLDFIRQNILSGIEKIKRIEFTNLVGEKVLVLNNLNKSTIDVQVNVIKGIYLLNLYEGEQVFYRKMMIH